MALSPRLRKVNHLKSGPPLPGGKKVYQLPDWKKMSDRNKVKYIKMLMYKFGRDPRIRNKAVEIYRQYNVQPRDYRGQSKALLHWVQTNVYYLNEPSELLMSPLYVLNPEVMNGDCDDIAILLGSLAIASRLGVKVVLSGRARNGKMVRWIEGTRQPRGVKWGHIYVQVGWPAFNPVHWESMEGTLKGAPLGWDVTRSHMYRPIPGAPGVPLFSDRSGGGQGFGAMPTRPLLAPPEPETPIPSENQVAQAGEISRARDRAEVAEREKNRVRAFWAALDWAEIATATLPAIISGFVLARVLRSR